jgi:hypothetical protein
MGFAISGNVIQENCPLSELIKLHLPLRDDLLGGQKMAAQKKNF